MSKQTARKWYKGGAGADQYDPGDLTGPAKLIPGTLKADLTRENPANSFSKGESYLVKVTLYGPEEIEITTTLTAWTASGDNIEIGED